MSFETLELVAVQQLFNLKRLKKSQHRAFTHYLPSFEGRCAHTLSESDDNDGLHPHSIFAGHKHRPRNGDTDPYRRHRRKRTSSTETIVILMTSPSFRHKRRPAHRPDSASDARPPFVPSQTSQSRKQASSSEGDATLSSHDSHIRVGSRFQAQIPEVLNEDVFEPECRPHGCEAVWKPLQGIPEKDLTSYFQTAAGYDPESAHEALYQAHVETASSTIAIAHALHILSASEPPKPWTIDESASFNRAFARYGTDFRKLQESVPNKTRAELVEHYWRVKHTQEFRPYVRAFRDAVQALEPEYLEDEPEIKQPSPKKLASKNGMYFCQRCTRSFATLRALCGHQRMHS